MTELLEHLLAQASIRRSLPEPPLRRVLRQRAGLSQQEIADSLGVNRVSVTRYENGQRTPRGQLGVDYAQLLDRLAEHARGEAAV